MPKLNTTSDARSAFLDFFARNGHAVLPSSPLVPHNDPTLMFTNAGMNQFKNIFTGAEKTEWKRAATAQKCVRAGGKHNDLDNVGYTARHHTFFEMLGNFSFGDYFKEEAVALAWELLTRDFGLDKTRLYFTVYHTDDEAFALWKKISGAEEGRILRVPTKDNFWAMGDTGPCGPCSEIFYDHGAGAGQGEWALNADGSDRFGERFVEIWNLVFMQLDQRAPGEEPVPLPKPSIDTGMGLERIAAVLQGVHDNYDIDLFRALIDASKSASGNAGHEISHRVIADHLRSSSFLIADGVLPSNEGRGYVLRRIMRRAMRHAHQLGCKEPLMWRLVPALVEQMGDAYPELSRAGAAIEETLRAEEERFQATLARGLKLLEEEVEHGHVHLMTYDAANISYPSQRVFPGDVAFKLYDTYGFPLDLTQDILRAKDIIVDTREFEKCMRNQREMARAAWSGSGEKSTAKLWFDLKENLGSTEFVGYDQNVVDGKVLALILGDQNVSSVSAKIETYIIFDRTPFYGESGGQVGDTGVLSMGGKVIAHVTDTFKPLEDFIVHRIITTMPIKVGDIVHAAIDAPRRAAIRANHSATHLLHKALRDRLGEHVTQKGSYVGPDRLRFDFSHGKALSPEDIAAVEAEVNAIIRQNTPVSVRVTTPKEAVEAGAMALFGEKYGEKVRVLSMGVGGAASGADSFPIPHAQPPAPYSVELCGGTHVRATGDIGLFKITGEGSVASGIRRIEAVTGEGARNYFKGELSKQYDQLHKLQAEKNQLLTDLGMDHSFPSIPLHSEKMNNAALCDLPGIFENASAEYRQGIQALQEENKKLTKTLAEARKQAALSDGEAKPEKIGSFNFVGRIFTDLAPKELRGVAEEMRKATGADAVLAASGMEGKASVVVAVAGEKIEAISAVALVQAAVEALGGKGGGGRPDMAQGGGPDASLLPKAVETVKARLRQISG